MASNPTVISHAHGIYQLDADYVAPGVACVYLLREGDRLAIIETGTANTVPHILDLIQTLGLGPENLDWVIPTHIHLDHAAGAGELIRLCPNARLIIHPRGAAHMIDPAKLEAGTLAVYGEEKYRQLYGRLTPVPAERVIEAPDNFQLDFNGRTLTFLDTPGHALHHFCVHDTGSNGIFSGDTFGLSYRQFDHGASQLVFVTTTPVHFDPDAMESSIDRLLSLHPEQVYLTHFGPIEPNEDNVSQLKASLRAFVGIALQEKDNPDGRVERLSTNINDWLLARIHDRHIPVDERFAAQWLKTDADLNAQGLDVWLKRQEKHS